MDACSSPNGVFNGVQDEYTRSMLDDLQLAAELGKTLLERNKELEIAIKQHQNVIDDQTQEIEYLTKQTVALREVNDSRLRIYEQLEVSIQDLERTNHRLAIECSNEKKHSKSLTSNLESCEARYEELQATLDEVKEQLDIANKQLQQYKESNDAAHVIAKYTRLNTENDTYEDADEVDGTSVSPSTRRTQPTPCPGTDKTDKTQETQTSPCTDDRISELAQLKTQLKDSHAQLALEVRRITELEDQLQSMVQQNQELENQIVSIQQRGCEMKSMHDEISTLEEVRQGQLCSKCLRSVDPADDMSLSLCDDREDVSSLLDGTDLQFRSSFYMEVQEYGKTSTPPKGNPYRDLVEKYEALKKVQKEIRTGKTNNTSNSITLQEELSMSGDFNALSTKDTDEESGHGDSLRPELQKKVRKTFSHTPTDFSEAETSSSGYSDETSNKSTQTLLTISNANGEADHRISIFDEAIINERFRYQPEFQDIFKEIFVVLKKAAQKQDENKALPLLDDQIETTPKVPPVTPCTENLPDFPDNYTDDTQSVLSSTMSELPTSQSEPPTVIENVQQPEDEPKTKEPVLRPLVRPPLESLTANVRKRSSSRKKKQFQERSDSPMTHILGSPIVRHVSRPSSGRRRRGRDNQANNENTEDQWNGSTIQFYSRKLASPTPSQSSLTQERSGLEYKPSLASQELHKLKKIDKSYADAVRATEPKKRDNFRGRRH